MTPDIVKQAAITLSPTLTGRTIGEILDAIERAGFPPGEPASFDSKTGSTDP